MSAAPSPGGRGAGRELFVWYRVEAARAASLRADIESMQRELEAACPGLRARLLVRDDGADEETWMETYAMQPASKGGIDDALQARIASAAAPLRDRIPSDRHIERFEAIERA